MLLHHCFIVAKHSMLQQVPVGALKCANVINFQWFFNILLEFFEYGISFYKHVCKIGFWKRQKIVCFAEQVCRDNYVIWVGNIDVWKWMKMKYFDTRLIVCFFFKSSFVIFLFFDLISDLMRTYFNFFLTGEIWNGTINNLLTVFPLIENTCTRISGFPLNKSVFSSLSGLA